MKGCLDCQGLVGDSEVREGANSVEVMGEVKGVIGQDVQITGSGHWGRSLTIVVWSQGFTGSQGPGLTWGPTVQQLHKVGWEGSQLPVLLPQPPAVLNLGRGEDAGSSGSAPRVSLAILNPDSPRFRPMTPLLPCSLTFPLLCHSSIPSPTTSLHPCLLTQIPSSPLKPLSSPHPLTSFITSTISPACSCSSSACSGV